MDEAKKIKTGEETQEEQKTLIQWIREHKKEIAIAGISITALVGLGLGIKNKEAMEVFWNALKNNDPKIPIKTEAPRITEQVSSIESVVIPMHREYKEPFDVSYHIRKLHEGWKASPEKLAKSHKMRLQLEQPHTTSSFIIVYSSIRFKTESTSPASLRFAKAALLK